jgi:hypothetical protein
LASSLPIAGFIAGLDILTRFSSDSTFENCFRSSLRFSERFYW